jgi:hypothetical protein
MLCHIMSCRMNNVIVSGHGDSKSHLVPKMVESLRGKDIRSIAAGGSHSLAFNAYFIAPQDMVMRLPSNDAQSDRDDDYDKRDTKHDIGVDPSLLRMSVTACCYCIWSVSSIH